MGIIKNTDKTLHQLINLVRSLNSNEFTEELNVLNGSTIGQHIRHIIEFYVELINGYEPRVVCYDNRKRNSNFETNQFVVISELNNIILALREFDLTLDLQIKSNHGLSDFEETISNSSVMREVVYTLDHTVHHLAIIKIAIQVELNHIELDQNMGIAPSTLRNTKKVCVQ